MESVSYSARELKNYIEIASTGHYPLFDPSWLNQKAEQSEAIKISIRNANQNVKKYSRTFLATTVLIEKKWQ